MKPHAVIEPSSKGTPYRRDREGREKRVPGSITNRLGRKGGPEEGTYKPFEVLRLTLGREKRKEEQNLLRDGH